MPDLLDQLNENQRVAASHIDGAMLILAGAGSGKTKTITTRLADIIRIYKVKLQCLCYPFSNPRFAATTGIFASSK